MIRSVIIEDEIYSRELLEQMLIEFCPDVQIVGKAIDVASGIALIKDAQPALVFLDVEMPGGNGFEVLNAFEKVSFKVVFVTGYDHYAIKAIRYSAIDYLLKPINLDDLEAAVQRVSKIPKSQEENISLLKKQIDTNPEKITQLILSDSKNHQVLKIEDIQYLEANRTYAIFYLENGQKQIATNSLQFYEELLPKATFFRIHKTYLVNCLLVDKVDVGRGGMVHLKNGVALPIAYRRKAAFLRFLNALSK